MTEYRIPTGLDCDTLIMNTEEALYIGCHDNNNYTYFIGYSVSKEWFNISEGYFVQVRPLPYNGAWPALRVASRHAGTELYHHWHDYTYTILALFDVQY